MKLLWEHLRSSLWPVPVAMLLIIVWPSAIRGQLVKTPACVRSLVQVASGQLDGSFLVLEQHILEVSGQAELGQPHPGIVREMVSDLQIDVVRRNCLRARPALLDGCDEVV